MFHVVHGDGGGAQSFILGIYRLDPGKMEQRIQQHGGVSVGKDKAVTIGPDRIFRIVTEEALPEQISHRRQGHRRSRVPRIRLLYRVHGQRADCIDAELIDIACVLEVFGLIGNFWQGYGKSHSLMQPPTDKPTLNWAHLGSAGTLFARCWWKPKTLPLMTLISLICADGIG